MTNRRPNLKLLASDMTITELPSTMPAVVESSSQRLAWQREIANVQDERAMIDEQIASAHRTFDNIQSEANEVCAARIRYAHTACEREHADAAKILTATTAALETRQADLDRIIAGLSAAVDASADNGNGFQAG